MLRLMHLQRPAPSTNPKPGYRHVSAARLGFRRSAASPEWPMPVLIRLDQTLEKKLRRA